MKKILIWLNLINLDWIFIGLIGSDKLNSNITKSILKNKFKKNKLNQHSFNKKIITKSENLPKKPNQQGFNF